MPGLDNRGHGNYLERVRSAGPGANRVDTVSAKLLVRIASRAVGIWLWTTIYLQTPPIDRLVYHLVQGTADPFRSQVPRAVRDRN